MATRQGLCTRDIKSRIMSTVASAPDLRRKSRRTTIQVFIDNNVLLSSINSWIQLLSATDCSKNTSTGDLKPKKRYFDLLVYTGKVIYFQKSRIQSLQ